MGIVTYLRETKEEMKHVSWPTQRQVIAYTIVVIIVSAIVAVYLAGFDYLVGLVIKSLFK